jgi:hypothetical protein
MRENWNSEAYNSVDVPDYYLPATEYDSDKLDGVTELRAPHGTRTQLAGVWYAHRVVEFWDGWVECRS